MNKCKKVLALLVVLVMLLPAVVVTANPLNSPEDNHIRKVLHMPMGTNEPYAEFNFQFELVGFGSTAANSAGRVACADASCVVVDCPGYFELIFGDEPAIDDLYVEFEPNMSATYRGVNADGTIYTWQEVLIDLDDIDWPHSGRFTFAITEEHDTNPDIDDCEYAFLSYSQAVYHMNVYVSNCADCDDGTCTIAGCTGLYIRYKTFYRIVDDAGEPEVPPVKVDAGEGEGGLAFTNIFVQTYDPCDGCGEDPCECDPDDKIDNASLYISKTVTGAGSQQQPFDFNLNLTIPSLLPDFIVVGGVNVPLLANGPFRAYLVEDGDVVLDASSDPVYIELNAGANTFQLRHNQSLHILGVPIGTVYNMIEVGDEDFAQSAVVVQGGATVAQTPAPDFGVVEASVLGSDDNLYVNNGLISNDTQNLNAVRVTNHFDFETPMGVFLNNLPFIGLVVLALGALGGLVALKVRKRGEAY